MKKVNVAICYDFDNTLATDNMQAFSFIPKLDMSVDEFWNKVEIFKKKTNCEPTLAYLQVMVDECKKKGIILSKQYLNQLGKNIKFYDGVTTWFTRLNRYAQKNNINLEHFIISSGNKEIIDGCRIAKYFSGIFGCEFLFDKNGVAYWPKNIINYTQKTQYLFRICKDAHDITDENKVNSRVAKNHVEFRNMIYIGDGMTDIPCMAIVKDKGGTAISVYTPAKKDVSVRLLKDDRVNYACKSDFRSNSQLEKLIKQVLDCIKLKEILIEKEQRKKVK